MILNILPQPDIFLFGIRIQEAMTTITDLLVTLVCFYGFWKIKNSQQKGKGTQHAINYFILMGIAIMLGGLIGHGFQYVFSYEWKLLGWVIGMFAVFFFELSTLENSVDILPKNWFSILKKSCIIKLIIALGFTFYFIDFKYVQLHMSGGFVLFVLLLHTFIFYKKNDLGSRWIITGILFLGLAAFVFNTKIGLHTWFNHIDLSHVFIAVANYFFIKGILDFGKTTLNLSAKKSF